MLHSLLLFAQQPTLPQIDSMYVLMLVARLSHILGVIILLGGLFYLRSVAVPPSASNGIAPADQFFGGRRAVWAKWTGIATALLLVAGIFNYVLIIKQHERLDPSYHMLMGLKMLAAIGVFLLAALFAGRTSAADKIRQKWRTWLTLCVVLGIVAVTFGSVLRTYPRVKKADANAVPQLVAPANAVTP